MNKFGVVCMLACNLMGCASSTVRPAETVPICRDLLARDERLAYYAKTLGESPDMLAQLLCTMAADAVTRLQQKASE